MSLLQESREPAGLVALAETRDLLCCLSGLNYGYIENRQGNVVEQTGFAVLSRQCAGLKDFDWTRLTLELDSYMDEVYSLVRAFCRT